MNSAASARALVETPASPWNAYSPEFNASGGPNLTPIVFMVDVTAPDRERLEPLIRSNGWKREVFGTVQEFLTQPAALVPSCLILNVSRDCDCLDVQKHLTVERPEMPIIVVAASGDVRMAVQAMKAGAIEFITRPFPDEMLVGAIWQAVAYSRVVLARASELRILKERYATLTRRERQVMELVVSGKLNKQVGGDLGISEITVKAHRGKMMQKMKADSLAQLVNMAETLRLAARRLSTLPWSSYRPLPAAA